MAALNMALSRFSFGSASKSGSGSGSEQMLPDVTSAGNVRYVLAENRV